MAQDPAPAALPFEQRIDAAVPGLTPAERRVARFFVDQKEQVLLSSAAQIAAKIGTSDATVVRTARSLGFEGLSHLREALLGEITGSQTPGERLQRTLEDTDREAAAALDYVVSAHAQVVDVLKGDAFRGRFARALDILAPAERRHVFGIGPSGALAEYAALQFNRIGFPTLALSVTGIALADRLLALRDGDAVILIAYGPVYREVEATLDRAAQLSLPAVLISDTAGARMDERLDERVAEVLRVPRGKADHLSMHAGTMALIEAMIIGLAARAPERAMRQLQTLGDLRGAIDASWTRRHRNRRG